MRAPTPALLLASLLLAASLVPLASGSSREHGTIFISVQATGGDGLFPFTTDGGRGLPHAFTLATAGGNASVGFQVRSGTFALAQVVPAGWTLEAVSCSDGSWAANVTVSPGETVTCTFRDAFLRGFVLRVLAEGGDAMFTFRSTGDGLPAWLNVTTTNGSARVAFPDLASGRAYSLAQVLPDGWRERTATCTTGAPANFSVPVNGSVTCTFTNVRPANVMGVVFNDSDRDGRRDANESGLAGWRVYVDADRDGQFDGGEANATTATNGSYAIRGLMPGHVVLREVVPAGWKPTSPHGGGVRLLAAAGSELTVDFGNALSRAREREHEDDDDEGRNAAGPGFWKHATRHESAANVTAWVQAIHASSAWLMPPGYAANASGAEQFLREKPGCGRVDREACERAKFEARYLVLRLNLASGRLLANDTVRLDGRAMDLLGLGKEATVQQVISAVEGIAPAGLDARDYRTLRGAVQVGGGHGTGDD